jgi:hypothetical protein
MGAGSNQDAEQIIANIREINEQVLEVGRKAGLDFMQAYEQTLRTFADCQDGLPDESQLDQLANVLRAGELHARRRRRPHRGRPRGAEAVAEAEAASAFA